LQAAQVFDPISQIGVAPPHAVWFEAEHWTQVCWAVQTGADAVGHARDAPEPWSPLQGAHVPEAMSHMRFGPQSAWFVAEHSPHAPEISQAGKLELRHARDPPDPKSLIQGAQTPSKVLQTGVIPEQSV
jgi:hypothetical protein